LCHLKKKVGFHKFRPDLVPFYKHKLLVGKIDKNGELVQRVFFPLEYVEELRIFILRIRNIANEYKLTAAYYKIIRTT